MRSTVLLLSVIVLRRVCLDYSQFNYRVQVGDADRVLFLLRNIDRFGTPSISDQPRDLKSPGRLGGSVARVDWSGVIVALIESNREAAAHEVRAYRFHVMSVGSSCLLNQ